MNMLTTVWILNESMYVKLKIFHLSIESQQIMQPKLLPEEFPGDLWKEDKGRKHERVCG
jgi:hypothetical protein